MQNIYIKKCSLFMVGSVCRVKRISVGGKGFADEKDVGSGGAEMAETTVKRLLCC
jgi:hypothetical protein